jgi:CubicO group peptidase (beta-lactamase class C family)
MHRWILLLTVLGVLLANFAPALALPELHEDEPHLANLAELEEALREAMWEGQVPGLSVAVVEAGEITWTAGLGLLDRSANRSASADSIFRVGSISKSFVSLAVLKLVEEGRLSLDDRVAMLAPEIELNNPWEADHPLRLVHLLEHTAGFDDLSLREFALQDADITLSEALAVNPGGRTSRWPPGLFFSYSNVGAPLAAYIVEKVSGVPFETYVQETFFIPLEMVDTAYTLSPEIEDRLSKSYGLTGQEIPYSHIIVRPAGSISTTPGDMGRFLQFLLGRGTYNGRMILQPASIEQIETPSSSLAASRGVRLGMGKGNFTSLHKGFVFHGHDGGVDGFLAGYGYLPDSGMGYYASINGSPQSLERIVYLLRDYLVRDLTPPVYQPPSPPAEGWRASAGYYDTFTPRMARLGFLEQLAGAVQVQILEDKLVVRPLLGGPAQALVPVGGELYRGENDPEAALLLTELPDYGRILTGGLSSTYRQVSAGLVLGRLGAAAAVLLLLVSSLLYALVWIPLWLLRPGRRGSGGLLRLMPLLAVLSLVVMLVFISLGFVRGLETLGQPSVYSVGALVFSILFALLAAGALLASLMFLQNASISLPARLYSLLVSLALVITAIYLGANGMIGLPTWL